MALHQRMMKALRGRRGLEPNDKSQDDEIRKMEPVEIVRECTAWELGDPIWAQDIADWMRSSGAKPEDF